MASAAKSELAALFVSAREMIPHRQTLIAMEWPQPKLPIQTDNSTAAGVTNKTIVPCRVKMMDMRLWWLRCRGSQNQFRYYWDAGSKTWADYHTTHHLNIYHKAHHLGTTRPIVEAALIKTTLATYKTKTKKVPRVFSPKLVLGAQKPLPDRWQTLLPSSPILSNNFSPKLTPLALNARH
jgi:hypothetical protein